MDGCNSRLFPGIFSVFRTYAGKFPENSCTLPNAGRVCGGGFRAYWPGGDHMNAKRHQQRLCEDLRLDPEARLCPAFDCTSIKLFAAPDAGEMGMRVLDNCAEENIK